MRAMTPPRSIWVPGSATQVRRPGVSAAMRASFRLTTVPVAVMVVVSDCWLALPTLTGAAGALGSCAGASDVARASATIPLTARIACFICVLRAIMRLARVSAA